MNSLKKLIIFGLVAMLCIIAGCTSEPEIKSPTTYVKIKSSFSDDLKTTNLDIKVTVDNPNPIGIHINKVKFDVYLLNNGEKVILKEVEKSDINIKESGTTPIEFKITIPNDKIISAIKNSKDDKITIGVDGYALVDAKIKEIKIPIKGETEIAIPNIKSPITNVEINVKPGVPIKIDARIKINNPNNIGLEIKELVADVYYMDNYGNYVKQIKHIEKQNIHIKENGITTIEIPITIGLNDLPSPNYVIENGGNIIIGVNGYAVVDAKIKEIKIPISGKITFESPFQLSDNSQLLLPNPPQPQQLPNVSVDYYDDNNYNSGNYYDYQQTQTQFSGINVYVDDIEPSNSIIISKIVMSPDLLSLLAGLPPEIKITMENGEQINLKYISMDVDLTIDNPNSKSITIDKIILNMFDDKGHSLGRSEISDIEITPGENSVTVKVNIPINKMGYEILRKLHGEEVFAKISGSAYIGDEEIPFSGEKELLPPLPAPPFPLPPLPPFPN